MGKSSSKNLENATDIYTFNNNTTNIHTANNSIKFKDVNQMFQNDESDKKTIQNEENEIDILSKWYSHVYLTKKSHYNNSKIAEILNEMINFIPSKHFDQIQKSNTHTNKQLTCCQVCYCDFDNNDSQLIMMKKYCSHSMICKLCFVQHLKIKIKDDDIMPWILCPSPDCKAPISPELLLIYLPPNELYKFCKTFIRKNMMRNRNWIQCKTKNCKFGWVIKDKNMSKEYKLKCNACKTTHNVSKNPISGDKGFNDLITSGILRLCPKCSLPTMKDKGMCNVMHCGKCGIYWNWRTRETGTSSSTLKNKSRGNGSLWEPGELAYQQNLQQNNLSEFIKLLERNGIKYDPNYVRGTR